jgi:VWFA-related protein
MNFLPVVLAATLLFQTTLEWIALGAAKERAQRENKLTIVFRSDDACGLCQQLMNKAASNPTVQRFGSEFVFATAPAPTAVGTVSTTLRPTIGSIRVPTARDRPAVIALLDPSGEEVLNWTAKSVRSNRVIDVGTFVDILQRASAVAPYVRKAAQQRAANQPVQAHLTLAQGFRQANEVEKAIVEYNAAINVANDRGDRESAQSARILLELTAASRGKMGNIELRRSIGALRGIVRAPESKRTEAEAWLALGQLLRANDEPKEAMEALERAARLGSASPEVRAATSVLLASSDSRLLGGASTVDLLLPERAAYSGVVRAQALTRSPTIASVEFLLDGRSAAKDADPPFEAKIDVGAVPRRHELRLVARNAAGETIGEDGVVLNDRHDEFSVRLALAANRTANATVDLPAGGALKSVEFFLDDQRIASLTKPPFTTRVGGTSEGSVLRVSAALSDGRIAEDVVLVGSGSELVEVHEVDLYATVHDESGALVPNLPRADFTVREEGVVRPILGFEYAEGAPFTVGLTIDSSTSMRSRISDVHESARGFLSRIAERGHAAFVVDFDTQPRLATTTTSDARALLAAIDGIRADGATALHDAIVFSLLQLQGVAGKRALIVLTDGRDEGSRYTAEDVARVARETGASVYLLSMSSSLPAKLKEVAAATGGRSFDLRAARELAGVYGAIESELQRQYRISFGTDASASDAWRSVDVAVAKPGLKVRTASGFVPR